MQKKERRVPIIRREGRQARWKKKEKRKFLFNGVVVKGNVSWRSKSVTAMGVSVVILGKDRLTFESVPQLRWIQTGRESFGVSKRLLNKGWKTPLFPFLL